jgi:hypothetical protein
MTSKRSIFATALCGLALVGAGCGGDDDDNGALSYEETGTEIGSICQSVQGATEGLNGDPANDAPILEDFSKEFQDAAQEIRDLEVAEELAATRDEFADNADAQIAIIDEAQVLAEAGDKKKYVAKVREAEPLDKESDALASKLGATDCLSDEG